MIPWLLLPLLAASPADSAGPEEPAVVIAFIERNSFDLPAPGSAGVPAPFVVADPGGIRTPLVAGRSDVILVRVEQVLEQAPPGVSLAGVLREAECRGCGPGKRNFRDACGGFWHASVSKDGRRETVVPSFNGYVFRRGGSPECSVIGMLADVGKVAAENLNDDSTLDVQAVLAERRRWRESCSPEARKAARIRAAAAGKKIEAAGKALEQEFGAPGAGGEQAKAQEPDAAADGPGCGGGDEFSDPRNVIDPGK